MKCDSNTCTAEATMILVNPETGNQTFALCDRCYDELGDDNDDR